MGTVKLSANKVGNELVIKLDLGKENLYLEKWKDNFCRTWIAGVIREEMNEDDREYYGDALSALEEITEAVAMHWDKMLLLNEWND